MARSAPYIPARDADFGPWLDNFSALLTASPPTFGLTSGDATSVASVTAAWDAAYAAAVAPSTRTPASVQAKNDARIAAEAIVRPLAQAISLNAAVVTEDKIAIGVNPRTATPSPITPPVTQPLLTVQGAANLQLTVRYRDSAAAVSGKSKPYGVQSVMVRYGISATAVTDPADLPGVAMANKSPFVLAFEPGDGGKQCYLAACYLMANGQTTPFGPMINFTVPLAT